MRLKYIFIYIFLPVISFGQEGFQSFIEKIESNNKVLISARELSEAESLEAKTRIYLSNPEVNYAHVFDNSDYHSELVVAQSFDFPTAYKHRNKIAALSSNKANDKYAQLKTNILMEASKYYGRLIGLNRKLLVLSDLQKKMEKLLSNAITQFDVAEMNVLEFNRIKMEVARATAEYKILESEKTNLLLKVAELNGGTELVLNDTSVSELPALSSGNTVVTELVTKHPFSNFRDSELKISEQNIALQKANNLPKFQLGYRQNATVSTAHHGFVAGFSIPLFENKNSVKLAKARYSYMQQELGAKQLKLENSVKNLIQEYETKRTTLFELENVVQSMNTTALLMKSYEAGQISYSEFFAEYENFRQTILYIEELKQEVTALQLKIYLLSL